MAKVKMVLIAILAAILLASAYYYYNYMAPIGIEIEDEYSMIVASPQPVLRDWMKRGKISSAGDLDDFVWRFGIRPRPFNFRRSELLYSYEERIIVLSDRMTSSDKEPHPSLIFVGTGHKNKWTANKCFFVRIKRIRKSEIWYYWRRP